MCYAFRAEHSFNASLIVTAKVNKWTRSTRVICVDWTTFRMFVSKLELFGSIEICTVISGFCRGQSFHNDGTAPLLGAFIGMFMRSEYYTGNQQHKYKSNKNWVSFIFNNKWPLSVRSNWILYRTYSKNAHHLYTSNYAEASSLFHWSWFCNQSLLLYHSSGIEFSCAFMFLLFFREMFSIKRLFIILAN